MPEDIRNRPSIGQADVIALNFVNSSTPYVLRNIPAQLKADFDYVCSKIVKIKMADMYRLIIEDYLNKGLPDTIEGTKHWIKKEGDMRSASIQGILKDKWKKIHVLCVMKDIKISDLIRFEMTNIVKMHNAEGLGSVKPLRPSTRPASEKS